MDEKRQALAHASDSINLLKTALRAMWVAAYENESLDTSGALNHGEVAMMGLLAQADDLYFSGDWTSPEMERLGSQIMGTEGDSLWRLVKRRFVNGAFLDLNADPIGDTEPYSMPALHQLFWLTKAGASWKEENI